MLTLGINLDLLLLAKPPISVILDKDERKEMEQWRHGGVFSLHATVRIEAHDRRGLERLLRYCARPAFAAERLEEIQRQQEFRSHIDNTILLA